MEDTRYSAANLCWYGDGFVKIMEDRALHKYQLWVQFNGAKSEWVNSPDEALKDYNSKHDYPKFNKPNPVWPNWYGNSNVVKEEN